MKPFYEKTKRESKAIQAPAIRYAESRGWMITKFEGGSENAWPDTVAIRKGRVVFVEFKKDGEVPTPQQLLRHQQIRDHGGEVEWFDNLDAAKEFFR